ncbi:hypothetical protein Goarm_010343, partial [Gossypium armourianum]|nr:hypothetical protein [Gossypium armourianum]
GVDPKSILCEFFKVGKCAKGFKCKFSHDLNVQRKGEKIYIYSDKRDQETMEDCDQETLEKVVESKAKEYQQNKPTDIVLLEEESEKTPIEEEIENQRAKLKTSTPMTPELFMEWKKKKIAERDESLAAQRAERAKNDRMSGRELFMSDASLFVDDAKAYEKYQREEEYDVPENKNHAIILHVFDNETDINPISEQTGPAPEDLYASLSFPTLILGSTSATSAADAESLTDDDD